MKAIEYRTMDKSTWGEGPWMSEPDKAQWKDEATGLPCLIVRNYFGALCGYVGVDASHPWHGKDYNACVDPSKHESHEGDESDWHHNCTPGGAVDVHGGLTFAAFCADAGNEAEHICHFPEPGEPEHVWWFGFDCGHCNDTAPAADARDKDRGFNPFRRGYQIYRDVPYVKEQIAGLARQLAAVTV